MKRTTSILFLLLITELAIGGGGRLTAWGPVSLRMVLFAMSIVISLLYFIRGQKIPRDYVALLFIFVCVTIVALIIGIYSGAERTYWWEDIKPLLYFFILPFFYYAITDINAIKQTSTVFKFAGIFLSFIFLLLLILIHLEVIPFLHFYQLVNNTQEFFFRGEITFFYKGFLFLCIAFLFLHFSNGKYKFFLMGLLLIAILLTVTRGLWVALLGTYAAYYFSKSKIKSIIFLALTLFVVLASRIAISKTSEAIDKTNQTINVIQPQDAKESPLNLKPNLLGDRKYSDDGRIQQIKEVAASTTFFSALIGHGFGNGTSSRPVHMEISYLEIFHKQGIVGLAFWSFLLLMLLKKYLKAPPGGLRDAFFFASFFVFLQSFTNQYINNPIGLSVLLLSLVCLDGLRQHRM